MNRASLFMLLSILMICPLIAACESPYAAQKDAVKASYQRGELKANDYYSRMNELESLEQQYYWQQQQQFNEWNAQRQRQEIIDQNKKIADQQRQHWEDKKAKESQQRWDEWYKKKVFP